MKIRIVLLGLIVLLATTLRLVNISNNPPGLYIDEVSIGENAWTILTSGKDEYGTPFPVYFKAYGEYKLPVYIYLTSLSEAVFGKTEFAVRFPSAVAGILTIIVFYFLLQTLEQLDTKKKKNNLESYFPVVGAFLLAVTPWQVLFSRGGFEANLGVFFFLVSSLLLLRYVVHKNHWLLLFSIFFAGLTLYTYSTYRVITPLFVLGGWIFLWRKKVSTVKQLIPSVLLFFLFCLPIFVFSLSSAGQTRFLETSAFSEYPVNESWKKMIVYPLVFLKDYLSFFSPAFLFSSGDGIGRHQPPGFGPLFRIELVFIIVGIVSFIKKRRWYISLFTLFLLFLSPMPAAIAKPSPHTLRSLLLAIPLTILAVEGIFFMRKRKILLLILLCIGLFEGLLYFHIYTVHYPRVNSLDWGGGYKDTALKAEKYHQEGYSIYVDSNLDFAPIYFKFYAPDTPITQVPVSWHADKNKKALLVRPYYGDKNKPAIIDTVYLPTVNHDVFAQFWKL